MTKEQMLEHLRGVEQSCHEARIKLVRGIDWGVFGELLEDAHDDLEKVRAEVDRVNMGRR